MIRTLFVSALEQIVVQNIPLTGSACQNWRSGDADLEAVFPCDAVLVQ
jgi:hypothetical protein